MEQEREPGKKSFFERAAYVVTPGSVVIGLLYYLGNRYRSAYYSYFGIPMRDLELTPQDYLLDSPTALFFPLWVLLVVGLVGVLLFRTMERRLAEQASDRHRRLAAGAVAAVGAVLLLISFPVLLEPLWWQRGVLQGLPSFWLRDLLPPVVVAVGILMLLFALYLRRSPEYRRQRHWNAAQGLLLAAVAMILFFAMARYAYGAGMSRAQHDAENGYQGTTRVLVHSRTPIHASAPSITCEERGRAHQPYRFRCTGFRILAKSRTRYFLVPHKRPSDVDVVLVLHDDDNVRVEVVGMWRGVVR
jgi:NADH:ubiquinone oxidoreductase subunit 6 (subunit J)